jgi:cell division inhibitor SulA/protein ImuA
MAIPDVVSADPRVFSTPDDLLPADRDNSIGTGRDALATSTATSTPRPPAAAGTINRLLEHPALWRAGQLQRAPATHATGFAELDAQLPGGGWPQAGLAEFLLGTTGIGELRVLAPLIRALSREQARWIAWINPPFTPYAPALEALGIELDRMLVINPRTHREALWALEQTSRSGACSLALAWLDERQLKVPETRRLQFAAQQGRMLTCLFRPEQAATTQSMAELRLQLAPAEPGSLVVDIRKRRGGWPVAGIRLTIDKAERPESLIEKLSAWRRQRSRLAGATPLEPAATAGAVPGEPDAAACPGTGPSPLEMVPPVTH